jgi:hypothetical protein
MKLFDFFKKHHRQLERGDFISFINGPMKGQVHLIQNVYTWFPHFADWDILGKHMATTMSTDDVDHSWRIADILKNSRPATKEEISAFKRGFHRNFFNNLKNTDKE